MDLVQKLHNALNRITKWRSLFAGWQLGTRSSDDPECQAVRDHREVTILLRVEATALTQLLLEKGVCTQEELQHAIPKEAELLNKDYENRFPGVEATDMGLKFDHRAVEWMKNWKP